MRGSCSNVLCRHPRFSRGRIKSLTIYRHVGGEDEAVLIVGGDRNLTLGQRNIACAVNHIDLLTIGDALATLNRPNGQSFVGVDA